MEKYWIINREVYTDILRVNPLVNSDALKIAEGTDYNEFIVTQHTQFQVPLNILNIYGEQE